MQRSKDSIQRMRKTMRKMQKEYSAGLISAEQIRPRIASWLAHARHADSRALCCDVIGGAVFNRKDGRPVTL